MRLKFLITTLLILSAFITISNAQPQSDKLQNLQVNFSGCESNSIFKSSDILNIENLAVCNSNKTGETNSTKNLSVRNNSSENQTITDLQTAIDALGVKGGVLGITAPINCTSKITEKQTENLILEFTNDGKIVYQSGCNLIILI